MLSKLTTKIALHKAGLGSVSLPSIPKNADGTTYTPSNPFSTITVPKSWASWTTPPPPPVPLSIPPDIGSKAPSHPKLRLPTTDGRPTVVALLRFCGCPFAEKTFLSLRTLANRHPNVHFVAVSHSSAAATERWVKSLGGAWAVTVIVDEEREIYASWGLGTSNTWHVLNPWSQWNQWQLGKNEGFWVREVGESASRWQIAGTWAMDRRGTVIWGGPAKTADDLPNLEEAVAVTRL